MADGLRGQDLVLVAVGFGTGAAVVVATRLAGRRLSAGLAAGTAVLALVLAKRLDDPVQDLGWPGAIVAGTLLAAAGARSLAGWLPAPDPTRSLMVVASGGAVWLAVPETGPILVVGGVTLALLGLAFPPGPWVAEVLLVALGWSTAVGAPRSATAAVAAVAGLGMFVWWLPGRALRRLWVEGPGVPPGSWLLAVHAGLALAAARWVAVDAAAPAGRLVVVGVCGVMVAAAVAPQPSH